MTITISGTSPTDVTIPLPTGDKVSKVGPGGVYSYTLTGSEESAVTSGGATLAVRNARSTRYRTIADVEGVGVENLRLLTKTDFQHIGGFKFATADQSGYGSLHGSNGTMTVDGTRMFITGRLDRDSIHEYAIPTITNSTDVSALVRTSAPSQMVESVKNYAPSGNPDGLNEMTGLFAHEGKLIVNSHEWYDGDSNATDTTLVMQNIDDLVNTTAQGWLKFPGGVKSAGWVQKIPDEWVSSLGKTHLCGYSSTSSIMSRHSIGPSFHAFNIADVIAATAASPNISTDRLMEFSVANPLSADTVAGPYNRLNGTGGDNDIWTNFTGAYCGFIVPNTRTYACFGNLTGLTSGLGYKITPEGQSTPCAGYCSYDPNDHHSYYWLFDMLDIMKVKNGVIDYYSPRPYEYGIFDAPYRWEITGGTYDIGSGRIYLSVSEADTVGSTRQPAIAVYTVATE